jgi:GNAT superfamily N-acetyltransferase
MFFYLLLGCCANEDIRMVEYYRDMQSVKTYGQIMKDYNTVYREFHGEDAHLSTLVENLKCSDMFELREGKRMVAFISFVVQDYFTEKRLFMGLGPKKIVRRPCAVIYSLYVAEEYRGMGYARTIMKASARALKRHYNLSNNFILLLHLDPRDRHMEEAFCLYYSLNFRAGAYSMRDPEFYKYRLDEIYKFRDALEIIDNPDSRKGRFFILACEYSGIGGRKREGKKLRRYAKKLREILGTATNMCL